MPFTVTKSAVPKLILDFSASITYDGMIWNFTFSVPKSEYDNLSVGDVLVFTIGTDSLALEIKQKSRQIQEIRANGQYQILASSEFIPPVNTTKTFATILAPFEAQADGRYNLETLATIIPAPGMKASFQADGVAYLLFISGVTLGAQRDASGQIAYVGMSIDLVAALPIPPLSLEPYVVTGVGTWLCRHYAGRDTLLGYKPAPIPGDEDPPYFDALFADVGTVSRQLPERLVQQGYAQLGTINETRTETLSFAGSQSASTEKPVLALTSSTIQYAKNAAGDTVAPRVHAHNGGITADMPFYGAVTVTYQTTFTFFMYYARPPISGRYPLESDYGTVYMIFGTVQASAEMPPIPIENSSEIPLWEITTSVLVDATAYNYVTDDGGEWEVPNNWPQNLAYGGGNGNAPDEDTASVDQRVVQRAWLKDGFVVLDPPLGFWRNKRPYIGVQSWKPRFIWRQAPAPEDAKLLELYDFYDFETAKDQLANAESFFYQHIFDESGNPL